MPRDAEKFDERVDEFACGIFKALGLNPEKLPDEVVESYLDFKKIKDEIYPGRLSPEGFAAVLMLAGKADARKGKVKED